MNRDESIALFKQGRDAWNAWAEQKLSERRALEKAGCWFRRGDHGDVTELARRWHEEASGNFNGYTFEEDTDFSDFIFPGKTNFVGAIFRGKSLFRNAQFMGSVQLKKARFENFVWFEEVIFEDFAGFSSSEFIQYADFTKAIFNNTASFEETIFRQPGRFAKTVFKVSVNFSESIFEMEAEFDQVEFDCRMVKFNGARFDSKAKFTSAFFSEKGQFSGASFDALAWFEDAIFKGSVKFDGVRFAQVVDFRRAIFEGDALFRHSEFRGFADFSNARFGKGADFGAIEGSSAFSFSGSTFDDVPDFIQAHFSEAPRCDDLDIATQGFWPRGLADVKERFKGDPDLAARWRALKRLAIQGHDHENEQIFFKGELLSRRWHADKPWDAAFWFGVLYQWLSDFGRSLLRPLLWWGLSLVVFAGVYVNQHDFLANQSASTTVSAMTAVLPFVDPPQDLICRNASGDPITAAFDLSIRNALLFVGQTSRDKLRQNYDCLYGANQSAAADPAGGQSSDAPVAIPYFVALMGHLQNVISAVLIFLFLLGLRNHFKIK